MKASLKRQGMVVESSAVVAGALVRVGRNEILRSCERVKVVLRPVDVESRVVKLNPI